MLFKVNLDLKKFSSRFWTLFCYIFWWVFLLLDAFGRFSIFTFNIYDRDRRKKIILSTHHHHYQFFINMNMTERDWEFFEASSCEQNMTWLVLSRWRKAHQFSFMSFVLSSLNKAKSSFARALHNIYREQKFIS